MVARDSFCCCHIATGAALVGMLQLIIVVASMSSSGIILDRWVTWDEWYEEDLLKLKTTTPSASASTTPFEEGVMPETWRGAFMEIQLAEEIGICAVWLLALLCYAGAFKYYKAVFVLPNYILQVIALISTFVVIIALGVRLGDPSMTAGGKGKDKDHHHFILSSFLAMAVVSFFVEIFFLVVIHKFYRYLKSVAGLVFPGLPAISLPMKPSIDDAGMMA